MYTYTRGTTQVHNLFVVGDFCHRWSNQWTKLTEILTVKWMKNLRIKEIHLNYTLHETQ